MADPDSAFTEVSDALRADPDDDVTREGDRLLVKGRLFGYRDGQLLVLDLPAPRAADLTSRGIAVEASGTGRAQGAWVGIPDTENWSELAGEAHQFVGEPPVGRQS